MIEINKNILKILYPNYRSIDVLKISKCSGWVYHGPMITENFHLLNLSRKSIDKDNYTNKKYWYYYQNNPGYDLPFIPDDEDVIIEFIKKNNVDITSSSKTYYVKFYNEKVKLHRKNINSLYIIIAKIFNSTPKMPCIINLPSETHLSYDYFGEPSIEIKSSSLINIFHSYPEYIEFNDFEGYVKNIRNNSEENTLRAKCYGKINLIEGMFWILVSNP